MNQTLNIGFIGAGNWAKRKHLPALHYILEHELDTISLYAIADIDKEAADAAAQEYGFTKKFYRVSDLVADGGSDCYVVVVGPQFLPSVVDEIIEKGKPIFSEKPPGCTADAAAELARKVVVPNVVGFNRRYYPIAESFKARMEEITAPFFFRAVMCRHGRRDSMAGSNHVPFVTGTGVHMINLIEYIFGSIESAETRKRLDGANGFPYWTVEAALRSGIRGRLDILPCSGAEMETFEVHNESTSLFLTLPRLNARHPIGSIDAWSRGEQRDVVHDVSANESDLVINGFVGEYMEFFAVTRGTTISRSTLAGSVNTMRVAEAIEMGRDIAPEYET